MVRLLYFIILIFLTSCSTQEKSIESSSVDNKNTNNTSESKISGIKYDTIKKNKKENVSLERKNEQKVRRSK